MPRFKNNDQQKRYQGYIDIFRNPDTRKQLTANPHGASSRRAFWDGYHGIAHRKPERNSIAFPIYRAGEYCAKQYPELVNRY